MPKALTSQSKELVASLINYFEQERDCGGPLIPLTAVRERVAAALQLSLSTVNHISSDVTAGNSLRSPKKKRSCSKPVCQLEYAHEVEIHNVIYSMYEEKEHITLQTLLVKLKERFIFEGSRSSLWQIIKRIGFSWKKDDPRRGLMEISNIAFKRVNFLRSYINSKNEGLYQFVFLDETWLFQDGIVGRSWQDKDVRSVKSTKVEGKRYIVLHAGNVNGFIDGAELIFSTSAQHSDYHGYMNKDNFLHWFEYQLLNNLKEPSIIIMDNASYHSTVEDRTPTTTWKKGDIQEWLRNRHINFDTSLLKTQLLQLVLLNKPQKTYVADTLAMKYGHKVLRLPPYHCLFNPIENVWGITKSYYNKHVGRDGRSVDNCIALWKEALGKITPEVWSNCIRHAEEIIKSWWEREIRFDRDDIAPIIINLNDDSDEDNFDWSDEST